MTERTERELAAMTRRLDAVRMTDAERLEAVAAMRSAYIIVDQCAWLAQKIVQLGALLFGRRTLAR